MSKYITYATFPFYLIILIALLPGKFVTDQLITTDLQPEAMKILLACCIMEFFVCPGSLVAMLKDSTPVLFLQVKPSKFIR